MALFEVLTMDTVVTGKKFKFTQRFEAGVSFETRVERIFREYGMTLFPFGMSTLPLEARRRLILLNDPTSMLLRFAPDYFCIGKESTVFIECKTSMGQTANYSYNLDSYNAGCELARLGIRILVIFGELHAAWIDKLPIRRVYNSGDYTGSGKAFVLIAKADLLTLSEFLEREQIIKREKSDFF